MTPPTEVDTRPLSEKLAAHIQPASFTLNMMHGEEVRIVGTPLDIDRVRSACKQMLKRIESGDIALGSECTVIVPARDPA